jgi:hypothetical protein
MRGVVLSSEEVKSRNLLVLCFDSRICWIQHSHRCHTSFLVVLKNTSVITHYLYRVDPNF